MVTTVCYGQKVEWISRESAKLFFLEAMRNSDGAEHDRYYAVYADLENGLDICTDAHWME